jgi:hypothetical protein
MEQDILPERALHVIKEGWRDRIKQTRFLLGPFQKERGTRSILDATKRLHAKDDSAVPRDHSPLQYALPAGLLLVSGIPKMWLLPLMFPSY